MQIISSDRAASLVASGDTVLIGGSGGGHAVPESLIEALERRYLNEAAPTALCTVHPVGIGDKATKGVHRLRHPGLLRRVVCGTVVDAPGIAEAAAREEIELFTLPQGSLSQQMRELAAGRPGLITQVGLHTFVDPRAAGGSQGRPSDDPPIELVTIDGREYIRYKPFEPRVALLRGSTADEAGNISMEDEAYFGEGLSMAQAVKRCGGTVVVQVARVVPRGTIDPKTVKIPHFLVDHVVIAPDQPTTYETASSPAYAGRTRLEADDLPRLPPGHRNLIARRAALELTEGAVCNLGSGISTGIAVAAAESGLLEQVVLTNEQGLIGGMPMSGLDAGAAVNYDAMVDQPYQFDLYDGGGLDLAFLSFAEISASGDVNISRFNGRIVGVGGFVNITQGASTVVFSGTFTTGGLVTSWDGERLRIDREGRVRRFLEQVGQISFSGAHAAGKKQRVVFVTERAVFELDGDVLVLTEVAPGIEIEHDVLAHMDFAPKVDRPRVMDARLFESAYQN